MKDTFNNEKELLAYLDTLSIAPLRVFARSVGVIPRNHPRQELLDKIVAIYNGQRSPEQPAKFGRPVLPISGKHIPRTQKEMEKADRIVDIRLPRQGIVEVLPSGGAIVKVHGYVKSAQDYTMDKAFVEQFGLVSGDKVDVMLCNGPSGISVSCVVAVNDQPVGGINRTPFDNLVACHPTSRIKLARDQKDYALRVLDLVAPLGRGQRGLIIAPPRTGKTTLIKKIALAVKQNAPDIATSVLLIDQTPEEVTEFVDCLGCDVVYTTFDQPAQDHVSLAEAVIANAKRRVEQGQHVMLLVDSLTNLVDAYARVGESNAIGKVKALFGNARCIKDGGSLTILATAFSRPGNNLDDNVCQVVGRIANMVVYLDRRISQKRIFPAIDINQSGTDKEDLLFTESQAEGVYSIRRMLSTEDVVTTTEQLLEIVTSTTSNDEAIETLKRLSAGAESRRGK